MSDTTFADWLDNFLSFAFIVAFVGSIIWGVYMLSL